MRVHAPDSREELKKLKVCVFVTQKIQRYRYPAAELLIERISLAVWPLLYRHLIPL